MGAGGSRFCMLSGLRKSRRISSLGVLFAMTFMLIAALAVSGCGGCSANKTPIGTYSVVITATSGSLNHSATYSYTVK